jgi:hypothetical protein
MNSLARSAGKNLFLRGFIAAIVALSTFATLAAYRHLVPNESPRLLSLDHEVRRVLARAERINLRTGVTCENGMALPDTGPQLCTIAIRSKTLDHPPRAAAILIDYQTCFGISALNQSTVLNL